MLSLRSFAIAAMAIMLPNMASAAVIYDLTLTDASNPAYSGTGVLKLNVSKPAGSGQVDYTKSQVASLTFTIDGQTFTYGGPKSALSAVRFDGGQFDDISFSQEIGSSPNRYDLQTTSYYVFAYDNELKSATGTITSRLAAVPEPSTWAMMIVGLGVTGIMLRRRKTPRQGVPGVA